MGEQTQTQNKQLQVTIALEVCAKRSAEQAENVRYSHNPFNSC